MRSDDLVTTCLAARRLHDRAIGDALAHAWTSVLDRVRKSLSAARVPAHTAHA